MSGITVDHKPRTDAFTFNSALGVKRIRGSRMFEVGCVLLGTMVQRLHSKPRCLAAVSKFSPRIDS